MNPSKRRYVAWVILGSILVIAMPARANRNDELKSLRSRIQSLQKELASSEESRAEAADSLRESERAISDVNRKVFELGSQLKEANTALGQLHSQNRQVQELIEKQQAALARQLTRQYMNGQSDTLKLLLNAQDPNQIARELYYFGEISRTRAQTLNELRINLAQVKKLSVETQQKTAELAALQAEEAQQKKLLEQEKRSHQQLYSRISSQISKQRKEISTLKHNENRLTKLVERLGRIAATPPRKKTAKLLNNEKVPDETIGGGPFQQLKGKLNLPVRGELINRFGTPRPESGVIWRGLFIRSPQGQEVKAVAAGTVIFADWLRGFGNLLIIDHGQGYMSLYGNNESLYKQVGIAVRSGEVIAAVGNSGGNADSGLYFELRFQSKPFDPLTWTQR